MNRAGNPSAKKFFKEKVERQRQAQFDIAKRWREQSPLSIEEEQVYYDSWIPQALHMLCLLDSAVKTPDQLAKKLGISEQKTQDYLNQLAAIGILAVEDGAYQVKRSAIHLRKDSKAASRGHQNWRLKTALDIANADDPEDFHFTAVVTMTEKEAKKIHKLIHAYLDQLRATVLPAPSRKAYVHLIDFYPL